MNETENYELTDEEIQEQFEKIQSAKLKKKESSDKKMYNNSLLNEAELHKKFLNIKDRLLKGKTISNGELEEFAQAGYTDEDLMPLIEAMFEGMNIKKRKENKGKHNYRVANKVPTHKRKQQNKKTKKLQRNARKKQR